MDCARGARTPSPSPSQTRHLIDHTMQTDALLPTVLQVIFKVYEEKEQAWQKEYMRLRSQYESSLLVYQQKALRAERQLLLLTQQVSGEGLASERVR